MRLVRAVNLARAGLRDTMHPTQARKLVRAWTLPVVALVLLGAAVAYVVSKSLTPIYPAKGALLVVAAPNASAGASSLNINATQATTTAATLLTTPPLLQQVIDNLHLNVSVEVLAQEVVATPQSNTELVDVVVNDASPTTAAQIDNAIMTTYVAQVTDQNTQRINQAGAALQAQIADVQATLGQEQQELASAQKAKKDTAALRATISSNAGLLTQVTLDFNSFKSTQAQGLDSVSVAAPANVPTTPASPRPTLNTVLGGGAGLVVGLNLVAILEYLDQGLENSEDVVTRLGLPCLGIVPRYRVVALGRSAKGGSKEKRAAEAASEAYRRLRTNLLFATPDAELKSIVITSVRPGEGKTCIAANLSVALASSKKVLLIDADMRRPDQHRLFGKRLDHGMSELILRTRPENVPSLRGVHKTQFANLSLLTSGTIPPNPSDLLASRRARLLLRTLATRHDLLVIDTPPAGLVTDALSLAADASVTVLVVEAGRTNAAEAAQVIESLRAGGANVAGVVLNKAQSREVPRYYYQYGRSGYTADADDRRSSASARRGSDSANEITTSEKPLGLHTPATVHYGQAAAIREQRAEVLAEPMPPTQNASFA